MGYIDERNPTRRNAGDYAKSSAGEQRWDFAQCGGANVNFDPDFVGISAAFNSILQTIKAIATRKCPVILAGETGTGKEIVARRIHAYSDRRGKVFVPVDCTTLTGQLFESQLFGHVKGAFTGAIDNTLGFFRAADGGTIFMDEISEIPLELQAKLLRVLQENMVTPLGSTKGCPIDVRVLCATNKDLRQEVREKRFRADLYYRLNVVTLEVPPLRERMEDVLPLAEYFLAKQAHLYGEPPKALTDSVKKLLLNYHWPGNAREVANAMERAYVLSLGSQIRTVALPPEVIIGHSEISPDSKLPTIDDAQRKLIIGALDYTRGHKLAAARILGVERRRLNRLIEKLGISVWDTRRKAGK